MKDFPFSGRTVPEFESRDLREVVAPPFRVLYIVRPGDIVEIQAIYRSSRDLRRILGRDPLN